MTEADPTVSLPDDDGLQAAPPSASGSTPGHRRDGIPSGLFGYVILDRIGEGAGSIVYSALNPDGGERYALKHVVVRTRKDERLFAQLQAELKVGRLVKHPALRKSREMKVRRSWMRRPKEAVLLMELVDGVPLDGKPAWDVPTLCGVFARTAEALQALHGQGYVHCDMKPGNVLVGKQGVKVIDLGQACAIGTIKERVQGTPDFISPEQVNCQPVSHRTDVFNLGAMMYLVLSGRKLPTLFTIKKGGPNSFLMDTRIDSPSAFNSNVPDALSDLVMQCVRTNSDKRPRDMAEVVRRLDSIQKSMVA